MLTRSNSAALGTLMQELKRDRTVHITGGVDDLVSFAKASGQLKEQGWTSHPELACFSSWAEVVEYAAQDPLGDDLALMVKIVDEYGPEVVVASLENMPPPHLADLVVTTTHKAKGLEWNLVKLAGDFPLPAPGQVFPDEEYRLLYVAATRAKFRLDPTMVPAFNAIKRSPA